MEEFFLWVLVLLFVGCLAYILFLIVAALLIDPNKEYTRNSLFYQGPSVPLQTNQCCCNGRWAEAYI